MKALLLYSTIDGQSEKIMQAIAAHLAKHVQVEITKFVPKMAIDLSAYTAVCIGASVRYGRFNSDLRDFINQTSTQLNEKVTAFYTVSLIARKAEKCTPTSNIYTSKFLNAITWRPPLCETFAGALRYSTYHWFERFLIQQIMRISGGETDTRKDIEYTDWQQVDRFAEKFANMLKNKTENPLK